LWINELKRDQCRIVVGSQEKVRWLMLARFGSQLIHRCQWSHMENGIVDEIMTSLLSNFRELIEIEEKEHLIYEKTHSNQEKDIFDLGSGHEKTDS
jgi:hypothetical protein